MNMAKYTIRAKSKTTGAWVGIGTAKTIAGASKIQKDAKRARLQTKVIYTPTKRKRNVWGF